MKKAIRKISDVLKLIYGYGITIAVLLGGLSVLGFIAAMIIGGDTAAVICEFINKKFFGVLILASNIIVLIGLLAMYLSGEQSMSLGKDKKKAEEAEIPAAAEEASTEDTSENK